MTNKLIKKLTLKIKERIYFKAPNATEFVHHSRIEIDIRL